MSSIQNQEDRQLGMWTLLEKNEILKKRPWGLKPIAWRNLKATFEERKRHGNEKKRVFIMMRMNFFFGKDRMIDVSIF